jgi:hypothetical protein
MMALFSLVAYKIGLNSPITGKNDDEQIATMVKN